MYKTISFLKVSLITYHKHSHNTNSVCILVWHSIIFTMGYRMVSSMAMSIVYKHLLTKKILGGPTFHVLLLCLSYWAASSGVILQ